MANLSVKTTSGILRSPIAAAYQEPSAQENGIVDIFFLKVKSPPEIAAHILSYCSDQVIDYHWNEEVDQKTLAGLGWQPRLLLQHAMREDGLIIKGGLKEGKQQQIGKILQYLFDEKNPFSLNQNAKNRLLPFKIQFSIYGLSFNQIIDEIEMHKGQNSSLPIARELREVHSGSQGVCNEGNYIAVANVIMRNWGKLLSNEAPCLSHWRKEVDYLWISLGNEDDGDLNFRQLNPPNPHPIIERFWNEKCISLLESGVSVQFIQQLLVQIMENISLYDDDDRPCHDHFDSKAQRFVVFLKECMVITLDENQRSAPDSYIEAAIASIKHSLNQNTSIVKKYNRNLGWC